MAADNLKTAFRQPRRVNEDLQEFIMAAQRQQQHQKNINQQQQNISQFKSEGVSKYTQWKDIAEVCF